MFDLGSVSAPATLFAPPKMGRLLPSLQDALAHASAPGPASSSTPPAADASPASGPSQPAMPTAAPANSPRTPPTGDDDDDVPLLLHTPETLACLRSLPGYEEAVARPPSPPPRALATTGWDDWSHAADNWGAPRPRWYYDAHPYQSGWNASAPGHGATVILNTAYCAEGRDVPPLNMCWHRPDQRELSPFGHNQRGDIAPAIVHALLDDVLEGRTVTPLEFQLLHSWIDGVWFRHSRSRERCIEAVRRLDYFNEREVNLLAEAMHTAPLTDFRAVAHVVDPRMRPVYGRTLDGEGQSRLFRMFPLTLGRPDPATWDEDDGDLSGSSREASDNEERPFTPTLEQRLEKRRKRLERRARRAIPAIERAEREMDQIERRLRHATAMLPASRTLEALLLRGMRAPQGTEYREPIWQGWS